MAEILKILSVGGDVGVWVVVFAIWRLNERMLRLEMNHKGHADMDEAEFKRINHRLESLERT